MVILSIRTDKPEAEIGLFKDAQKVEYYQWQAHRELSSTILIKLNELLNNNSLGLNDIDGIIVYKGPGSFTGLRIGISVANTLSESLAIPIVGETRDEWLGLAINKILSGTNDKMVVPEYGQEPHITTAKK